MIDPGLSEIVVLVTDGNNPYGIGAAIASAFASHGSKIFIHYFRQEITLPDDSHNSSNTRETGLPFF
jgi:NAD(P)-dependent dehydrogenase (short-subunit alcohol dehydrogenase family)